MPKKSVYWNKPERYRSEASDYYKAHADERRAYARHYYELTKDADILRDRALRSKHRITTAIYQELLIRQQHVCAVCRQPETRTGKYRLSVDHDHNSGLVRGLLCFKCNVSIGSADESAQRLRELADYIEGPPVTDVYITVRPRRKHRVTSWESR